MLKDLLKQFNPAVEPLLDLVSQATDDAMLQEIARADYGQDFDQHRAQLIAIKNGVIHAPMEWHPREVLELTRWLEVKATACENSQLRTHRMKLFACMALLHADVNPKNEEAYHWSEDATVIQLVESALRLGKATAQATLSFCCWCMLQERADEEAENCLLALGVLLLSVSLHQCNIKTAEGLVVASEPEYVELTDWLRTSQRAKKWALLTEQILVLGLGTNIVSKQYGEQIVCALRPFLANQKSP